MGRRRANLAEEHFFFVTTTAVKFIPIFNTLEIHARAAVDFAVRA
jgi:hypothetical protein